MNPAYFSNAILARLIVVLSLVSPILHILPSRADEAISVSGILGRTVRLDVLCDDFEDTNWHYNYEGGFWRSGSGRGEPELLTQVTTPAGGKSGSVGALEIRTNVIDSDNVPNQEDLLTVEFKQKLGYELIRAKQPLFLVHVWLPPFDQWGDYYKFGFRQEFIRENGSAYYASIFLVYYKPKPFFVFRIHPNLEKQTIEVRGTPIKQSGWWTLAIAFDKEGIDYYYVRPGTDIPTKEDKVFDTRKFRTKEDTCDPSMDKVNYSFFSLMYPETGNTSPRIRIDDYEVWMDG